MDDPALLSVFGAALGLVAPWEVVSVEFDELLGRLEIGIDFPRGSRFACPEPECSNKACPVHDTMEKRWRHLEFFEHQAFLLARVPRVDCALHGVHLVPVPWARPSSGFTLLLEVAMLTFAAGRPAGQDGPGPRHADLAGARAPCRGGPREARLLLGHRGGPRRDLGPSGPGLRLDLHGSRRPSRHVRHPGS
jgi:hypothetical protein